MEDNDPLESYMDSIKKKLISEVDSNKQIKNKNFFIAISEKKGNNDKRPKNEEKDSDE